MMTKIIVQFSASWLLYWCFLSFSLHFLFQYSFSYLFFTIWILLKTECATYKGWPTNWLCMFIKLHFWCKIENINNILTCRLNTRINGRLFPASVCNLETKDYAVYRLLYKTIKNELIHGFGENHLRKSTCLIQIDHIFSNLNS